MRFDRRRFALALVLCACLGLGCPGARNAPESPPSESEGDNGAVSCTSPRPRSCPGTHAPVCGQRDTGIRCVTTPCDSSEPRDYRNACHACRDVKVLYYVEGPCEAPG